MRGFGFLGVLFLLSVSAVFADPGPDWQISKSDHFIIYSAVPDSSFSAQVLRKAEEHYETIASWLSYSRRDSFWTWNDRCKIYIYKTKEDYITATGHASWSNGSANLTRRTIVSFHEAPDFINSILPHELAHLVFRDFIGSGDRQIPLWLDEGIAMAQEKLKRQEFDNWMHQMIRDKNWIAMKEFMAVRSLNGRSGAEAAMFYAQAQSVARFLLEDFGSARFAAFCRSLRDAQRPEEALRENYPKAFPNLQTFEERWLRYASQTARQGGLA